jgi:NTP pyrophosphatase (non-canonical NTP hydrolase)
MLLDEYQTGAASTAIYPGELIYPTLGLCGEMGELFAAIKEKRIRCDGPDNIKKEASDVLWYAANIAKDIDVLLSEVMGRENFEDRTEGWGVAKALSELAIYAGEVAENVKKAIRDNDGVVTADRHENIVKALRWVVIWLERLCSNYGATLGEGAQLNLDKLRSRAERGVLKGDGDAR